MIDWGEGLAWLLLLASVVQMLRLLRGTLSGNSDHTCRCSGANNCRTQSKSQARQTMSFMAEYKRKT
ncbi:MAG: hypothetical protein HQM06_07820 [Magnetococcales bacterium]|nr:hypothetical protein [Magnetococcales bacterium]